MEARSMNPKLLDLFCCQGGAGMGYHRAGFDVTGVDLFPQPRYPREFIQADAVDYLLEHGHEYDAIHASPPCQAFTNAQKLMGNEHPNFIDPIRELLLDLGKPFVIENVPGAPLESPFELCGAMFGLGTYRHRLFETNFYVDVPDHPKHEHRTTKMGRKPVDGEMMHVVGNFSGVAKAKEAMGIDWMTRDGLRESIPPAYTQHIGASLMNQVLIRKDIAA
jgi:DNA (cytosine-5)-methyltransferase 1